MISLRKRGKTWHARGTIYVNGVAIPVPEFSTKYHDLDEARRFVASWEVDQHRHHLAAINARREASDRFRTTGLSNVLPDWARAIWKDARRRASASGVVFDLGEQEMCALINRAAGKCEVSGIEFGGGKVSQTYHRPFVASIDRINAASGYTHGNCRLVIAAVNVGINQWGEEIFIAICKATARKHLRRGKRASLLAQAVPNPIVFRRSRSLPSVRLADRQTSASIRQKGPETLEKCGGRDRD